MKNQDLFSSKDKSKKLKCHLLQFLLGASTVKSVSEFLYAVSHNTVMLSVPKSVSERISFHMNHDQFEVALQLAVSILR